MMLSKSWPNVDLWYRQQLCRQLISKSSPKPENIYSNKRIEIYSKIWIIKKYDSSIRIQDISYSLWTVQLIENVCQGNTPVWCTVAGSHTCNGVVHSKYSPASFELYHSLFWFYCMINWSMGCLQKHILTLDSGIFLLFESTIRIAVAKTQKWILALIQRC